jgi:hypothetical protein
MKTYAQLGTKMISSGQTGQGTRRELGLGLGEETTSYE